MKQIPGFPKYKITRGGEVWSIRGKKFLIQKVTMYGYREITLCKHGKKHSKKVHRLVLETFIGPCPKGMQACHNNGVKQDNRLENLRWDTGKNNELDKVRHGTALFGEKRHNAKLTEQDVKMIIYMYGTGLITQQEIAGVYSITQANVSTIVLKKSWKYLGENHADNLDKQL